MKIIIIIIVVIIITMISFLGCTFFHEIRPASVYKHNLLTDESSITYIGHATVLIHLDNMNIITDPMFSKHLSWFFKRYVEPGIRFEELPPVSAILISHEHSDHLDKSTLRRFSKNIPVFIPKGLGKEIWKLGFRDVREMQTWQTANLEKLKITGTPAKHMFSRKCTSFIIEGSKTIFFAGDTGLTDEFSEIGRRFEIDLAVLPIGDYHPYLWFIPGFSKMTRKRHMAPDDIPKAIEMLKAQMVIPIHWGTFKISGTRLNAPVKAMKKIISGNKLEDKVFILNHGETKIF